MTDDDAAAVRGALERAHDDAAARVVSLDRALAEVRSEREFDNADDEHDPEGVTLSAEWSRLEGLHREAEREREAAEEALRHYADASFGHCIDCEDTIPSERLIARPTATRCVTCAQKAGD